MTVRLTLPEDVEKRLLAQVQAGRYASIEQAILEKISQQDDPDLLALTAMDKNQLRRDLDEAWNNRQGAIDGNAAFARIAKKSASLKAQGK